MGQSPGSQELLQGLGIVSGGTTASAAESIYIGPGSYEINGTWEIYSKNVWISPSAVITGTGAIQFYNPSVAGGASSSTYVDGNNSAFIDVNVVLQNAQGMRIVDRPTASLPSDVAAAWSNTQGNSSLNIGKNLNLAVNGADVWLDNTTTGNLAFDGDATISNYRPERMVITNNSIMSHVVKEDPSASFVYPIGIADGDYTPAQVTGSGNFYASVQDYAGSTSDESALKGGPERTWHIYANAATTATVALQHNSGTDTDLFVSANPHFVTQFDGTEWSVGTEESGMAGTFTTGTAISGASTQDLSGVSIPASGTAGTSYFTKSNKASALPVTLVSFVATQEGQSAHLNWSTTEEWNADRFEIERSSDATNWKYLGKVQAAGESKDLREYSFLVSSPLQGINYYRLKMIDKDATFTYSPIRNVSFDSGVKVVLYPNPVSDRLYVRGTDHSSIESIEIISSRGQVAYRSSVMPVSGINLNSFVEGHYIVRLTMTNGVLSTQKIVVVK